MSDIFVSYASEDRERIMPLVRALEKTGWTVFWDRTIPTGKTWREVIGTEIKSCRSIVVVWSKTSVDSRWVQEEAEEASQRHILFPVLIEDVELPFGFGSIQAASLIDWNGKPEDGSFQKLIADLAYLLGNPPAVTDEAKRKAGAEEEEKRRQEEELRRKAEEESKLKVEEDDHRRAEKAKRKAEEERKKAEKSEKGKPEMPTGGKVSSRSYLPWLIAGAVIITLAGMFLFSQKKPVLDKEVSTPPTVEIKPVPEATQHIEKEVPQEEPLSGKGRLYVKADPSEARIRILNIKPAYTQGMELDAGEYHIEVSKREYEKQDRWVTLDANRDLEVAIELQPLVVSKQPPKEKVHEPLALSEQPPKKKLYAPWKDPFTGMRFVRIPGGCYTMGDTFGDGNADEKPVHQVCVDVFSIGIHEVTQKQWQKVMGNNPSYFKGCDNCPVDQVSWNDVQAFIKNLNSRTGKRFRLPKEAEWEYAARSGGKKEKFAGFSEKDHLYKYGNFCDVNCEFDWKTEVQDDGHKNTSPVGSYRPNGLGLYDMSGNVFEWVNDWYDENYYGNSPKKDPEGPSGGTHKVLRGGSWDNIPGYTRAADRFRDEPDFRSLNIGFRLALSP